MKHDPALAEIERHGTGVSVQEYASRIKRDMGMTIEIVMRIGETLTEAKADFAQQQKKTRFFSARAAYKELLAECGLSNKSAWALIQVSGCHPLMNHRQKNQLPQGWTLLRELALLPKNVLKDRLRSGDIHPKITRKEITSWKPETVSPGRKNRREPAAKQQGGDYDWRVEERVREELEVILPEYSDAHEKHLEIINTYKGVLTSDEYNLIRGLLHSDNYPGIDDVQRARLDKGFDVLKQKKELLCQRRESEKLTNTLPNTLGELLARRK
jgi:hypothetical protein